MKLFLEKLISKVDLSFEETKEVTKYCLEHATDAEIAAFLTALQAKGETAGEVAGIAEVIMENSTFQLPVMSDVMDNCGTGGDQSSSFNISTTSAFVIAGAGIKVAKHGNRSVTSKSGSADVLEALGISLSLTKDQAEELLQENNIAFLFAPNVHTSLQPFTKVRRALGIRTVFNLIGPLVNPVNLDSQLLGVYDASFMKMLAEALRKLGRKRALVVHGAGGLDEATLAGENQFVLLDGGEISSFSLSPEDAGLPEYPVEAICGGGPRENAEILLNVLKGKKSAYYDTVLLNAGLGIYTSGKAGNIREGIEMARESIESGQAYERLQYLIEYSKKIPGGVV